jgi:S-methylmethionine-dependent homocysteine/selenocysteine methylase
MSRYRDALPQLGGGLFLTDGGIETSMIHEGFALPEFAVFPLLATTSGEAALRRYFEAYIAIARRWGAGLVLETATWRASSGWGALLGYDGPRLREVNRRAVRLLEELRDAPAHGSPAPSGGPTVISGCVGPAVADEGAPWPLTETEAEDYHGEQIAALADAGVDMIGALTIDSAEEATGIVRAAASAAVPVAVSFTVETDGRLATDESLGAAVGRVDAATGAYPVYYMVNCAHPSHFAEPLLEGGAWVRRVRGLRANASRLSHAELDALPAPDPGDPEDLGRQYARLKRCLPRLNVFGGCCGTDHRHLEHVAAACAPLFDAGRAHG